MISALGKTKAGWGDMRCWAWVGGMRAVSFRVVRTGLSDKETFQRDPNKCGEEVKEIFSRKVLKAKGTQYASVLGPNPGKQGWLNRERRTRVVGEGDTIARKAISAIWVYSLWDRKSLEYVYIKALYLCLLYILSVSQNIFFKVVIWYRYCNVNYFIQFIISMVRGAQGNSRAPWR